MCHLMQQGTRPKTMKIFYFAWLKEHTGCSFEDMHLPEGVETVGALIPISPANQQVTKLLLRS